jgi:superfamily II DNA helicase RecQ
VQYCTGLTCRRKELLKYFGDALPGNNCKNCDFCIEPEKVKENSKKLQTGVFAKNVVSGGTGLTGNYR